MDRTPPRRCARLVAALCAAGVALFAAPLVAHAEGAGAPAVRTTDHFPHGYIEYTGNPGDTFSGTVTVTNGSQVPGDFVIYPADGLTSQVGGIVYADRTDQYPDLKNGEFGAGTWVHLSTSTLHLAGQQNATVSYTITVPASAHAGDHVGSLSAENPVPSSSTANAGHIALSTTARTVVAMVVHVRGTTSTGVPTVGKPYFTVENQRRQILTIPLTYDGDVIIKPVLDVQILDVAGRLAARFQGQLDSFMPHTTLLYPFPIDSSVLPPGTYDIVVSFGAGGSTGHLSGKATITPALADLPLRTAPPGALASAAPGGGAGGLATVAAAGAAGGTGLALAGLVLGVVWFRRRCTHCGRRHWKLISVTEVDDVRACDKCRDRHLAGGVVRLDATCYRDHVHGAVRPT